MYPSSQQIVSLCLSFHSSQRIVATGECIRSQPSVPYAKLNFLLAAVWFRPLVVSRTLWVALLYLVILKTDCNRDEYKITFRPIVYPCHDVLFWM